MTKEFPVQQLDAEEQELNESIERGEWVEVKRNGIPPCRCCGGEPEQVYFYGSDMVAHNAIHRCNNCGFQVIAKDEFANSEELWIKANEKHNPFIEVEKISLSLDQTPPEGMGKGLRYTQDSTMALSMVKVLAYRVIVMLFRLKIKNYLQCHACL